VSEGWQAAYVAVSAALGDRVDDALASLAAPLRDLTPAGAALARELQSPSRDARVRALARAVSEVALAVEAMVPS
jgi:hypothetical protein